MTPTAPFVLAMRDWPRGFCPLHFPNAADCRNACLPLRWQLAQLQLDYRDYWTQAGLLGGAAAMAGVP